jgi:hypothetical protein
MKILTKKIILETVVLLSFAYLSLYAFFFPLVESSVEFIWRFPLWLLSALAVCVSAVCGWISTKRIPLLFLLAALVGFLPLTCIEDLHICLMDNLLYEEHNYLCIFFQSIDCSFDLHN